MIWRVFAKATVAFIKNLKGMAALLFVEQGIHFLIWDWTRGTSNWTRMWNVYKKPLKAYLVMNISVYGFLYIMVQILNFHWVLLPRMNTILSDAYEPIFSQLLLLPPSSPPPKTKEHCVIGKWDLLTNKHFSVAKKTHINWCANAFKSLPRFLKISYFISLKCWSEGKKL